MRKYVPLQDGIGTGAHLPISMYFTKRDNLPKRQSVLLPVWNTLRDELVSNCHQTFGYRIIFACVRQIIVAESVGPKADEFLLKVENASKGWPWYQDSPIDDWVINVAVIA